MKIIITEYFEKHFNKIVSDLSMEDLINKVNIESKNFINLKNPYFNSFFKLMILFKKSILFFFG